MSNNYPENDTVQKCYDEAKVCRICKASKETLVIYIHWHYMGFSLVVGFLLQKDVSSPGKGNERFSPKQF